MTSSFRDKMLREGTLGAPSLYDATKIQTPQAWDKMMLVGPCDYRVKFCERLWKNF